MQLRVYQNELSNDLKAELKKHRAVCAVLPTGGGKTVIFASMGAGIVCKGRRIWFLAHRDTIVEQMSNKLNEFHVWHGTTKNPGTHRALVGMVQTTKNRLAHLTPPDVLVIDECHHIVSNTYNLILSAMPPTTKIIGFTATPERLDGKGLGTYFTSMVQGPQTAELVAGGYLVPSIVYRPSKIDTSKLRTRCGDYDRDEAEDLVDTPKITGDAVEHYQRITPGTSAIVFCVSVRHAEHVEARFRAVGLNAKVIHGKLDEKTKERILADFACGIIQILISIDLISEGVDVPRAQTAIQLRPTKSLSLYLQQVGRVLRLDPERGKKYGYILDHVGNTILHGDPEEPREWSLEGSKKRAKAAASVRNARTCSNCFRAFNGNVCPGCNKESDYEGREIEEVEGTLERVESLRNNITEAELASFRECRDSTEIANLAKEKGISYRAVAAILTQRACSLGHLLDVQRVLGYKHGWAKHKFESRHGAERYIEEERLLREERQRNHYQK